MLAGEEFMHSPDPRKYDNSYHINFNTFQATLALSSNFS